MKITSRLDRIVELVDEHSFLTVNEISRLCNMSEMTIRRDLEQLHNQKRLMRTYGGAVSMHMDSPSTGEPPHPLNDRREVLLVDQVDVLIGTSVNPYYDSLLIDRAKKKISPSSPNPLKCQTRARWSPLTITRLVTTSVAGQANI